MSKPKYNRLKVLAAFMDGRMNLREIGEKHKISHTLVSNVANEAGLNIGNVNAYRKERRIEEMARRKAKASKAAGKEESAPAEG